MIKNNSYFNSKTKENNLKILLISHYYPQHRGGIEIVSGKLIHALIKNHNVSALWIASDTDIFFSEHPSLKCYAAKTINFVEDKFKIPYPLWSFDAIVKIRSALKLVDIVHIHDYLYMGSIVTFILAKLYKKPIIITQHIGLISYKNPFFKYLLFFLNYSLGSFMLTSVDQSVFVSEVVRQYFLKISNFNSLPCLITNGVDTVGFHEVTEEQKKKIRSRFSCQFGDLIFLFVGRFVEKKGLKILEKLVQRFPDVLWCFAGWGGLDPERWGYPNIRVFRNYSGTELSPLYQMADLLVLPSTGEGFPLVVQESMACGTPVMVSPEVAQAYPLATNLMFAVPVDSPDTITQWSKQIEIFCDCPLLLTNLRLEVAAFAQQHWSWDVCAQHYYQIFQGHCVSASDELDLES